MTSINGPTEVTRGLQADYTAAVEDEDSPGTLVIEWAEFNGQNQGCSWIAPSDWQYVSTTVLDISAPYPFKAKDVNVACLCVRATDHYGASGYLCQRITPSNQPPVASIADVSGTPTNMPRPLCSHVELSAEGSTFPQGDALSLDWSIQYGGTDANGSKVQLVTCDGAVVDPTDPYQHRCFYAAASGPYTVTLTITDTPPGGATAPLTSQLATFVVPVEVDMPPCLRQTDPNLSSRVILLSGGNNLVGAYQSRTVTVLSATDDCEPFPVPAGQPHAQFWWSVFDSTQANPSWVYQANSGDSFTVSQANYLNALPGDSIKVRVEVRDAAVQKLYQSGIGACASDETDICCGPAGCTGNNDCVRWTTWEVYF